MSRFQSVLPRFASASETGEANRRDERPSRVYSQAPGAATCVAPVCGLVVYFLPQTLLFRANRIARFPRSSSWCHSDETSFRRCLRLYCGRNPLLPINTSICPFIIAVDFGKCGPLMRTVHLAFWQMGGVWRSPKTGAISAFEALLWHHKVPMKVIHGTCPRSLLHQLLLQAGVSKQVVARRINMYTLQSSDPG